MKKMKKKKKNQRQNQLLLLKAKQLEMNLKKSLLEIYHSKLQKMDLENIFHTMEKLPK